MAMASGKDTILLQAAPSSGRLLIDPPLLKETREGIPLDRYGPDETHG